VEEGTSIPSFLMCGRHKPIFVAPSPSSRRCSLPQQIAAVLLRRVQSTSRLSWTAKRLSAALRRAQSASIQTQEEADHEARCAQAAEQKNWDLYYGCSPIAATRGGAFDDALSLGVRKRSPIRRIESWKRCSMTC
jgi:hypothetical protein